MRPFDAKDRPGKYGIRLDPLLAESQYVTERLTGLAKVWGAVKYFHPSLAYKEIDWDAALVRAIPRVKAARSQEPTLM